MRDTEGCQVGLCLSSMDSKSELCVVRDTFDQETTLATAYNIVAMGRTLRYSDCPLLGMLCAKYANKIAEAEEFMIKHNLSLPDELK